jgi:hypothetical protein
VQGRHMHSAGALVMTWKLKNSQTCVNRKFAFCFNRVTLLSYDLKIEEQSNLC